MIRGRYEEKVFDDWDWVFGGLHFTEEEHIDEDEDEDEDKNEDEDENED